MTPVERLNTPPQARTEVGDMQRMIMIRSRGKSLPDILYYVTPKRDDNHLSYSNINLPLLCLQIIHAFPLP